MTEKCISGKVKAHRVLHVQKYSESLGGWHQLGNMALFSANFKGLRDTSWALEGIEIKLRPLVKSWVRDDP
jgi:hypothetical protein